jgi:hypothetical protein
MTFMKAILDASPPPYMPVQYRAAQFLVGHDCLDLVPEDMEDTTFLFGCVSNVLREYRDARCIPRKNRSLEYYIQDLTIRRQKETEQSPGGDSLRAAPHE